MKPGLFNMLMECQIQSGLCVAVGGWEGVLVKKQTRVTTRPGQENPLSTMLLLFTCAAGARSRHQGWVWDSDFRVLSFPCKASAVSLYFKKKNKTKITNKCIYLNIHFH